MSRVSVVVSVTVSGLIALLITLSGCSSTNSTYQEELKKDEYLKSNFSTKKKGENADTPVKTTFDK